MKKTVYVNGVVVGEVESTGDVDTDLDVMRDFLRAKGLDRDVPVAQSIFMQALSFCQTAAALYERDLLRPPRNGLSVAPFVVNAAFSLELYLKALHSLGGSTMRGHELLQLYDALPSQIRDRIVRLAQQYGPEYHVRVDSASDFRAFVAQLSDSFTQWRYWYETGETGRVDLEPLVLVLKALDAACREQGAT